MKKIALLLLFSVLLSVGVMAHPINLIETGTPVVTKTTNLLEEGTPTVTNAIENHEINENIIYELNNNQYINAMTKGYSSIGIQLEEQFYHITITEDKIDAIYKLDEPTKVDYVLKTDLPEILYIYTNHETMSKTEILRTLIMEKDIPLKVVYRFVGILMNAR